MSQTTDPNYSILLLEDNEADANLVAEYLDLSQLSYELTIATRLSGGLKYLNKQRFDLILVDLSLADTNGIDTLEAVLDFSKDEVIIVLTGAQDEQLSIKALQAGAQDYLLKDSLNSEVLRRAIRYAMERANLVKKVEAHAVEMKNREILLRRIFDANTDAMLILSKDYEIKFLNPAAGELLEANIDTLIGETFPFELNSGETTELEIPLSNNSTRLVELATEDLIWEGVSARLATLRDVTSKRNTERALRREKERLSVTLDSISDGVITIDHNRHIERINQEASRITGFKNEEAVGKPLNAILRLQDPKTGKIIAEPSELLLKEKHLGLTPEFGIPLLRNNDEKLLVSADMRSILNDEDGNYGSVVVLRDITQQKLAEEELFKTQKLQYISLLAGGIAHDFNNILTAILGNISVVRVDIPDDHKHAGKLLAAEKAALQATSLTQQLLTFSKGGTPVLESTTVAELIKDCTEFILRGSNVRCVIHKSDDTWSVDADKGQLAQVMNNLLINADQAMPDGGIITIDLDNCILEKRNNHGLRSGKYLKITISDRGTGITPENLKRIFDPYFTTKESGNGLGLASSYSIIQSHNGVITVESEINEGSSFAIYIPKSTTETSAPFEQAINESPEIGKDFRSGQGRILVMDDMEAMMMVAGEIISMLGYEVEYATNGEEAIDIYKNANETGTPFDAVVFDLTVPGGMGGEEAAEILIKYDPHLLAIASSGYTTTNVMSDYENSPFTAVVPKPYRIKEMSEALHQVLKNT
ncbi:MAG: response regulator [Opitutaceae bacterium]